MSASPHIADILNDIAVSLAEDGTDVVLTWSEWPSGTQQDPVTQEFLGTPTPQMVTIKGFVHAVQVAASGVRIFNEFEAGDCIVDLAPDAPVDGKADLRFTIAGQVWVAKAISDKVAQSWDAIAQGQKLMRSVLLRKAT